MQTCHPDIANDPALVLDLIADTNCAAIDLTDLEQPVRTWKAAVRAAAAQRGLQIWWRTQNSMLMLYTERRVTAAQAAAAVQNAWPGVTPAQALRLLHRQTTLHLPPL